MDWFIVNTSKYGRNIDRMWTGDGWTMDPDKAKVYDNMKSADDAARDVGTAKSERADMHRRRLRFRRVAKVINGGGS